MKWALALALFLVWGCSSSGAGIVGKTDAAACGSCHTTESAAWSGSRLQASGTSPVFAALSSRAAKAWGDEAESRCVSCHQPGYGGDHGIGCVACHSASGNLGNRDGLLVVDTSAPISGPFANPISTPAHGSQAYSFLESPDLCGTCHQVTGPKLFVEPTLSEFERSPAASTGASCATCHMPPLPAAPVAVGSSVARARADHSFVGLDPPWGAPPAVAANAASRTLQLLKSGLELSASHARATADSQANAALEVTLANAAGHAVPTGVAFLRSVWIDVALTDANGRSLSVPKVLVLGSEPTRAGVPVALITDADELVPHVLAPGATSTLQVAIPASLTPPVRAVVTLRVRAVREDVLDALGLADRSQEVPTHEVAEVRVEGLGRP
jgi:hypothetical protein